MSSAATTADGTATRSVRKRRLAITVGDSVSPVSNEHNLLIGFHFGTTPTPDRHPAIVSTCLDPIDRDDLYECWWYKGEVSFATYGNARVAHCEDYAVTILQQPNSAPEDFRECTYDAYHELMRAVQQTEHRHLVKIWNYFSGINDGADDREKYRQFSVGRANVFEDFGILNDAVPTGTAVGIIRDAGLTIIALTSKHELVAAENPRQVSAFRYPRQYGPKSPKFSRGGCVSSDNQSLLLLSGTAAIVGHESVHPYDSALQTDETLKNMQHLCSAISRLHSEKPTLALDKECVLRVYVRDAGDRELVAQRLVGLLGDIESNIVFLNANICRRELMIEIDGVRIL